MILQAALWVLTLAVAVPTATLLIQCAAAWLPDRHHRPRSHPPDRFPKVVVLVPAHDEEETLLHTLRSLSSRRRDSVHVVVVADNCSDQTAVFAKQGGADVVLERQDSTRRGKGHAIAFGVDQLRKDPPDVLVVLDADMITTPEDLERLCRSCLTSDGPCQGISIMRPPDAASTRDQISAFAFSVKNQVRPLGMSRLGLPVLLTGTGMAFPWSLASRLEFGSSNVTEDMELASHLARDGIFTTLVADAVSWGRLPSDVAAATSQRTRWEQGHLRSIAKEFPRLLAAAVLRLSPRRLAFSLDLLIPPLSLLTMMILAVVSIHASVVVAGLDAGSIVVAAALPLALGASILIAWGRLGPDRPKLSRLLVAPAYIAWKLPVYLAALIRPEHRWVRTSRDPATEPSNKVNSSLYRKPPPETGGGS